jgi:hypothetical protein
LSHGSVLSRLANFPARQVLHHTHAAPRVKTRIVGGACGCTLYLYLSTVQVRNETSPHTISVPLSPVSTTPICISSSRLLHLDASLLVNVNLANASISPNSLHLLQGCPPPPIFVRTVIPARIPKGDNPRVDDLMDNVACCRAPCLRACIGAPPR